MVLPERHDDMVTRMLRSKFAKEVDFPLTRVGVNAGGLLIGAIETTSQAVAQVVEYFIDNPALLKNAKDKARQDDTPAFDAMVPGVLWSQCSRRREDDVRICWKPLAEILPTCRPGPRRPAFSKSNDT